MFQGNKNNLKTCWSNTESDFLSKLKTLGSVYMYQDKLYNIFHYDTTFIDIQKFDNDIDFDLSYININMHITMVYEDLNKKYKNLKNYKIIPIGWSIGAYMALYFVQKYTSNCIHCILFDPSSIAPNYIKFRLELFSTNISNINTQFKKDNHKISNKKYQILIKQIKEGLATPDDILYVNLISLYLRMLYAFKHIKLKFPLPIMSFINFNEKNPETISRKKEEIKFLQKQNHKSDNYNHMIFINKLHKIFYKKQPCNKIIKHIKTFIDSNT